MGQIRKRTTVGGARILKVGLGSKFLGWNQQGRADAAREQQKTHDECSGCQQFARVVDAPA